MNFKKVFILILAAILFSSCARVFNPVTKKEELIFINTEQEVSLGRSVAGQIKLENEIITSGPQYERLEMIGERIARQAGRDEIKFQFSLIKDKEMNAFAVPGGYIFVNSGLMNNATDDELANVLAHEVVHVDARHSVKHLQAALGYQLLISIALGGKNQVTTRQVSNVIFNLSSLGYSRSDELQADITAVKYSSQAGFNPQGMISFLEKLKQEAEKRGSLNIEIFNSHPDLEKRINILRSEIRRLSQTGDQNG